MYGIEVNHAGIFNWLLLEEYLLQHVSMQFLDDVYYSSVPDIKR